MTYEGAGATLNIRHDLSQQHLVLAASPAKLQR